MTDASRQRNPERQHRLAEALRANLRRRKAQQKERRSQDTGPMTDSLTGDGPGPAKEAKDEASAREPC